jgi:MFS family permease
MSSTMKKKALLFILMLGIISFFSDFTHEGGRSIYGPYLNLIGATVFAVAFASGLGEFIGHALRLLTGYIADKTRKYWLMMFLGYALNLLAIPLLAFVKPEAWQIAIVLILLERVGKAVRAPAKSALTSFTAPHLGAGKAFAINEALDQLGAFLGPLTVYWVISRKEGNTLETYQHSFLMLGIFAIITLMIIVFARFKYPNPDQFEPKSKSIQLPTQKAFWLYMIAIGFLAMGFIDYPIISYHLSLDVNFNIKLIPLIYAFAMGVDAIAALFFGHFFDKKGIYALIIAMVLAMFATPFVLLLSGTTALIIGVAFWGIGMGAQESILKAVVAVMIPKERRATGYGVMSTVFGFSWMIGSLIIGLLYPISLMLVVVFAITMHLISIIFLMVLSQYYRKEDRNLQQNNI